MRNKLQLICVDDKGCGEWLTYGKIYEGYHCDDFNYYVSNNKTWTSKYRKSRFMTTAEFRDKRIDQILEDD
jgi:hypothetical protein